MCQTWMQRRHQGQGQQHDRFGNLGGKVEADEGGWNGEVRGGFVLGRPWGVQ